jgi:GNAT superfamily N-acetyltransferase
MRLNQVTLPAIDVAASAAFYQGMGFELIVDAPHYARFKSMEGDTTLHIAEMNVRPSFGRKGIGTQLLSQACAAAKDFGLQFVRLTTFSHLRCNAPFYAKHGFAEVRSLEQVPHLEAALRHERDRGFENRIAMVKNAG